MKKLCTLLLSLILCSLEAVPAGPCRETTKEATRLQIVDTEISVLGRKAQVFAIVPDGIVKKKGECFNVILENRTHVPATLHWHGLLLPWREDGVAFVSQPPIAPGQSQEYNFEILQSGTFWMHSHYGLNGQRLMAAPLILQEERGSSLREVVLFLEDFSFTPTETLWRTLRKNLIAMRKQKGQDWTPELNPPMKMGMAPDLIDVQYDAYLTNRKEILHAPVEEVVAGEKVRLRIINAASSSNFHLSLGGLHGEIIATDGNPVLPKSVDTFPIASAQRYDVVVEIPQAGGAFPILARGEGTWQQTGLILKTREAKIPDLLPTANAYSGPITNAIEKELRAAIPLTPKKVDRTLHATLDGNMEFYTWAINKHIWPHDVPLNVKKGERVALIFKNNTPMSHPMHLHGHSFQVVQIDKERFSGSLRDTVLVMPGQEVTIEFDANNPGIWALHCHLLYHEFAGMMTTVQYEGISPLFSEKENVAYSRIYDQN